MTGTDVREALHAVADTTTAPAPDRVELQRRVRHERRRRTAGRVGIALAAAAVVAVGASALAALPGDRADLGPAVAPHVVGTADLQAPVHVVADGVLVAVDPQGDRHDLGPAEEVLGWTTESVWYVGDDSALLRRDLTTSDEGAGGWTWGPAEEVVATVQSAQLSADGRYLGWIDLRERLHVRDLKAGATADPVQLEGSGYLADLAQGTGTPLVLDGRGLLLLTPDGPLPVPREEEGWTDASATRTLVAVVEPAVTNVFERDGSHVRALDSVPGVARLSPYGDALASVHDDEAFVWPADGEPVRLDVPGDAARVTWGDDDTVLVSTFLDRSVGVYACDVATAGSPCAALDVGEPDSVTLGR